MSAFMHDVARASLPVAIALLGFTAVARAALWTDDAAVVRIGRQYLEPLSIWCLGAVGVQLFAVVAAGDAGALSLLLPIAMGAAAALLRPSEETTAVPATAEPPRKTAPPVAAPSKRAAAPAPSPPSAPASKPVPAAPSLWVKRADDEPAREGSLWSR
jgi:hypothetical protein